MDSVFNVIHSNVLPSGTSHKGFMWW